MHRNRSMIRSRAAVLGLLGLLAVLSVRPRSAHADPALTVPAPAAPYQGPTLIVPRAAAPSQDPAAHVPAAWAAARAPAPPPPIEKDAYSGQIVLADVASVAAIALGLKVESAHLALLGVSGYFLAAPAVHAAQGRTKTAFASLGTRTLLPLAVGLAGAGIRHLTAPSAPDDKNGPGCDSICIGPEGAGFLVGAFVGLVAAPILDASVLARTEWLDALPVVPSATVSATGGTVSLSGAF